MPSKDDFLLLSNAVFLKELEEPCLYNIATDELYEVSREAFAFLRQCDGSRRWRELPCPEDFLDYCLREGLLHLIPNPRRREFLLEKSPIPSLRYLELQITARCNLKCRHCYQGEARKLDLPLKSLLATLEEFERMQGLRLLISGGEPLMHPDFWELNEALPRFGFRSVLITNATLIESANAHRLKVHEVQVSLDGLEGAHDALRGKGTFKRALAAIESLLERGLEVSVATMVHAHNRQDFPELERLLHRLGIKEWNVDVPCLAGRLAENRVFCLPYEEAALYLKYGYGGGLYTSSGDYACGAHLCAVLPDGGVAKCGFFADQAVGTLEEGLRKCWSRIVPLRFEELKCDCPYLEECRGGCRYRALLGGDIHAPDPVQCCARGVIRREGDLVQKDR